MFKSLLKKSAAIILAFGMISSSIVFADAADSGMWEPVGGGTFTEMGSVEPSFDKDADGNIYVAYIDSELKDTVSVKKFDGQKWEQVGERTIDTQYASTVQIKVSDSGVPYIAYKYFCRDPYKAIVKKFDGQNWVNVGGDFATTESAHFLELEIDGETPYISYYTPSVGMSVKKFDGEKWDYVGSAAFEVLEAEEASFTICDSVPYVAVCDSNVAKGGEVLRYNSVTKNWDVIGQDFTTNHVVDVSLSVNKDAEGMKRVYLAYTDFQNQQKATVKRFNNQEWLTVGEEYFTPGPAYNISLNSDNGILTLGYSDGKNGLAASAMKFDGTEWKQVGDKVSDGIVTDTVINVFDEYLYFIYRDITNGSKATLMKFSETTSADGTQPDNSEMLDEPEIDYSDIPTLNEYTVLIDSFEFLNISESELDADGMNDIYWVKVNGNSVPKVSTEKKRTDKLSYKLTGKSAAQYRLAEPVPADYKIYFYDDASITGNDASFGTGVVSESGETAYVGVSNDTSATKYSYKINDTWYESDIERKSGWHYVEFKYIDTNNYGIYIDKNLVGTTTSGAFDKLYAVNIDTLDKTISSAYYVDDIYITAKIPVRPADYTTSMINDNDPAVTYTDTWVANINRGPLYNDYNNDIHFSRGEGTKGKYFECTFTGTGIEFLSERRVDNGKYDIYIDNEYKGRVSGCGNKEGGKIGADGQQVIYGIYNLEAGNHTIKGVKVEDDATTMAIVDAFVVYTARELGVTYDDTLNKVYGMTSEMEYSLDGAPYVTYDEVTFNSIDFSGDHILAVRFKATADKPAGKELIINFTSMTIVDATEDKDLTLGESKTFTVNINSDTEMENVTLVTALYDENDTMQQCKIDTKTLKTGETNVFTNTLDIPQTGSYKVKCFILDGLSTLKPLQKSVFIYE